MNLRNQSKNSIDLIFPAFNCNTINGLVFFKYHLNLIIMDTDNTPWRFNIGPHKLFAQEYLAEIREFSKAAALPEFEQLAMQFSD